MGGANKMDGVCNMKLRKMRKSVVLNYVELLSYAS